MTLYQVIGEVSYVTWDSCSVIYSVESGNTYLIENVPKIIIEECFSSRFFDEIAFSNQMATSINIDSTVIRNSLNSFIKMDLLEEVEN